MTKWKIIIVVMFITIGTLLFKMSYKYSFNQNRIDYKVFIDNNASSTYPTKDSGDYYVRVFCQDSKASWDYENWKLTIQDGVKSDKCYVEFNTINEKNYINNYIKNNVGTTHGKSNNHGIIVNEKGYRYEGTDPYNYVLFNNELWRIIGSFDTEVVKSDNSKETQLLTKIIRVSAIGAYTFNAAGQNYWETTSGVKSSLNILLNEYYYNALDGTNTVDSNNQKICQYSKTVPGNCDFRNIGLNEYNRNMVENVTWYLGGSDDAYDANTIYNAERGTAIPEGGTHATSATAYIGLAYLTDHGYSVKASSCSRSILLDKYNNPNCGGKSWMVSSGYEWTITPSTDDLTHVFYTNSYGRFGSSSTAITVGLSVRPTLYLKSSTFIVDGSGTLDDPYILGI